jgi:hypothetical protein
MVFRRTPSRIATITGIAISAVTARAAQWAVRRARERERRAEPPTCGQHRQHTEHSRRHFFLLCAAACEPFACVPPCWLEVRQ